MSRYTQRDEYGNADIIGVDSADLQLNLEFKEFNRVTDALNRLAAYEDAEEQGLLVVLPCKVGDTIWYAPKYCEEPESGYVEEISTINGYTIIAFYIDPDTHMEAEIKDFGKTVFLTREEAETALGKEEEAL